MWVKLAELVKFIYSVRNFWTGLLIQNAQIDTSIIYFLVSLTHSLTKICDFSITFSEYPPFSSFSAHHFIPSTQSQWNNRELKVTAPFTPSWLFGDLPNGPRREILLSPSDTENVDITFKALLLLLRWWRCRLSQVAIGNLGRVCILGFFLGKKVCGDCM